MPFNVYIGATPLTNIVNVEGSYPQNGLPTITVTINVENANSHSITKGVQFRFDTIGSQYLGGNVWNIKETSKHRRLDTADRGSPETLTITFVGRGFEDRLKRRIIDDVVYLNQATETIFNDIVTNYLDGEGFTTTAVATGGSTIDEISFQAKSVFDAFAELAERDGWVFRASANRDLFFDDPDNEAAPFDITDAGTKPIWGLDVDRTLDGYFNAVVIVGAPDSEASDTINETVIYSTVGAENVRELPVEYRVKSLTSVTLLLEEGDESLTVGVLGNPADANADVWYEEGSPTLILADDKLANFGDRFRIVYTSPRTLKVRIEDSAAIAARKSDAGNYTSGRYERVFHVPTIRSSAVATALANDLLALGTIEPIQVTYWTIEDGVRPGSNQTITIAKRNLDDTFYITKVSFRTRARDYSSTNGDPRIEYRVTAVNRRFNISFDEYISKWIRERTIDDPLIGTPDNDPHYGREHSENVQIDTDLDLTAAPF